MKAYTGIGSRETPQHILDDMTTIAIALDAKGYTLRSGGAEGADTAFEEGAEDDQKEIYLPWHDFNGNSSALFRSSPEAFDMAEQHHPAWNKCSHAARKLHARNSHQVLGQDLETPSKFVLCWTKGGSGAGGTGQALRIAKAHNIPIYDFGKPGDLELFLKTLPSL